MRRWNGWGDDSIQIGLSDRGLALLRQQIGDGTVCPDYPLDKLIERIENPVAEAKTESIVMNTELIIRKSA